MFKFGRGYIFNPKLFYTSGLTMNYMISVDIAEPEFTPTQNVASRYTHKIVNPNYYGEISHSIRWDDEL